MVNKNKAPNKARKSSLTDLDRSKGGGLAALRRWCVEIAGVDPREQIKAVSKLLKIRQKDLKSWLQGSSEPTLLQRSKLRILAAESRKAKGIVAPQVAARLGGKSSYQGTKPQAIRRRKKSKKSKWSGQLNVVHFGETVAEIETTIKKAPKAKRSYLKTSIIFKLAQRVNNLEQRLMSLENRLSAAKSFSSSLPLYASLTQ
jgi:hypothetical protein